MIERAPGIFEVELHSGQLSISEIKIFIVKGTESGRSLMVDAGFRNRDCLRVMEGVLEELGIRYDQLDIFLTHKHHDHCGLASVYAERGARLFLNRLEDRHCYDCLYYSHSHGAAEDQPQVLRSVGVTPQDTPEVWEMFMEINRRAEGEKGWEFDIPGFYYTPASAGDVFCYGNYRFEAVELSGHTYGQLGLYDADKKVLFIADQVINGIVPIVGTSYPDEGLLARYFKSLEYIKHHYTDCLVLPAHDHPGGGAAGLRDGARARRPGPVHQAENGDLQDVLLPGISLRGGLRASDGAGRGVLLGGAVKQPSERLRKFYLHIF